MVAIKYGMLGTIVLGICWPPALSAEELAAKMPSPMELLVETESKEIPPLLPVFLTLRLKNVSDQKGPC
jgi:hypothetical protein